MSLIDLDFRRIFTGKGPSYKGRTHSFSVQGKLHPRLEISSGQTLNDSFPFKPGAPTILYVGGMRYSQERFLEMANKQRLKANVVTSPWQTGLELGDSKMMRQVAGRRGRVALIINDRQIYGPEMGRHYTGEQARDKMLQRLEASGISRVRVTVLGITSWAGTKSFADKPEFFFEEGDELKREGPTVLSVAAESIAAEVVKTRTTRRRSRTTHRIAA